MITWVVTDALVMDSLNIFLITSVNYSKVEYINQYQEQLSFFLQYWIFNLPSKKHEKYFLASLWLNWSVICKTHSCDSLWQKMKDELITITGSSSQQLAQHTALTWSWWRRCLMRLWGHAIMTSCDGVDSLWLVDVTALLWRQTPQFMYFRGKCWNIDMLQTCFVMSPTMRGVVDWWISLCHEK